MTDGEGAGPISQGEILPPVANTEQSSESDHENGRSLAIENFHYYGNDLREFRLLAGENPDVANQLLKNRNIEAELTSGSYRFGVGATVALLSIALITSAVVLICGGIVALLELIGIILALALTLRVMQSGQWSDTSWFGKLVQALVRMTGGSAQ